MIVVSYLQLETIRANLLGGHKGISQSLKAMVQTAFLFTEQRRTTKSSNVPVLLEGLVYQQDLSNLGDPEQDKNSQMSKLLSKETLLLRGRGVKHDFSFSLPLGNHVCNC